jgi:hypothetical protein
MANQRLCSVEGCGKPHTARGWCVAHYRRWQRNGEPLGSGPMFSRGEPMRFFKEVVLTCTDSSSCLFWPFTHSRGYGQLWIDGKHQYVHRLVCAVRHGPPPTPLHEAAHECGKGTSGCVNQMHLRWATKAENAADIVAHGTAYRMFGPSNHLSKLTEEDVRQIRSLNGKLSQYEIADLYGVSQAAINSLLLRKTWAWVED